MLIYITISNKLTIIYCIFLKKTYNVEFKEMKNKISLTFYKILISCMTRVKLDIF